MGGGFSAEDELMLGVLGTTLGSLLAMLRATAAAAAAATAHGRSGLDWLDAPG